MPKRSSPTRRGPIPVILGLGSLVVIIIAYLLLTGTRMSERYAPLADAALEIKSEAAIGHLRLEEVIDGDMAEDDVTIWEHFDQSEWYARAMLEGGKNAENTFVPLRDPILRREIGDVLAKIRDFRALAEERWTVGESADTVSSTNQRFHDVFNDFLAQADHAEAALRSAIVRDLRRFRIMQGVLIALGSGLAVLIGIVFRRYEQQQALDMSALRKSRENLSITLDSIGDAVIATDVTGCIVRMNPIAEVLTGWTDAEAKGRELDEVFHIINAQTQAEAENPMQKVLREGVVVGLANHTALIARDGIVRQIADSGAPIRDAQGEISGVVLVFRDVTEAYAKEQLLRESEERYRAVVEDTPVLICHFLPGGEITQVNAAYCKYFDRTPEELIGSSFLQLIPEETRKSVSANISALTAESPSQSHEHQVCAPDGEIRWQRWSNRGLFDAEGRPVAYQAIGEDITARKRAEEALRRSETNLRLFMENARGFGLYRLERDDTKPYGVRTVFASPSIKDILEVDDPEDNASWFENIHKEDIERILGAHNLSRTTGARFDETFRSYHQHKREWRWIHAISSAAISTDGTTTHYDGLIVDVSDVKRAEEAIHASQQMLDLAFNNIPQAVFWKDLNSEFLGCNRAFADAVGFNNPEDIVGLTDHDLSVTKEEADSYRECDRRVMDSDTPELGIEEHMHGPDGSEAWLITNKIPLHDAQGKVMGILATFEDITSRKQADAERERLMRAIEQTSEIVIITDADGTIRYTNPAFERVTGYTSEEALDQNPRMLRSGAHDDAFYKDMWATLTRGETWVGRFVNHKKDGTQYTEEGTISPVLDASGRTANYVAVKRDITESIRLEEQYHQAQKVESIGRLAGGVAHDLNNLLSPILGYGEILLDDLDPNDARRESVDEILRAGLRARDLIRQLLAFSRKQTLQYKPVNMNRVLSNFEKLLRHSIREDVAIKIIPSANIPTVMADVGQIEQVIMNLSINAQDAMPEGGRLTIETALASLGEDDAISHQGASPGAYVMLAMRDTGCGMDAETREHLFEPFFSTKGEHGTGLGLATVYGIVKQHGGHIWICSEPGEGSTFRIYLPVSDQVCAEERSLQSPLPNPNCSESILLVEDDEQVRHLADVILRRQGYTVLVAESGPAALTLLDSCGHPVDMLLTDVVMPEMNGKELFARIAARHPDLKVLYMSGYTDDVIAHRGVLDEGTAFVQKPFTVHALITRVRKVLEQDRAGEA